MSFPGPKELGRSILAGVGSPPPHPGGCIVSGGGSPFGDTAPLCVFAPSVLSFLGSVKKLDNVKHCKYYRNKTNRNSIYE